MKALNQASHIRSGFDEAERCPESNLGYDVVSHEDSPRAEIEFVSGFGKQLVNLVDPVGDSQVDQGLHLLDVCKTIWACDHLPVIGMLPPILHIENAFGFSKAARNIVLRLVRLPMVDLWHFRSIVDEQQSGRDPNNIAIFLVQLFEHWTFVLLDAMVCYPRPRNGCQKGAIKLGQRVEKAVVYDLVQYTKDQICRQQKEKIRQCDLGNDRPGKYDGRL